MKQVRKRITYANVMSSIAVFLVLGGATAIAAGLAKNSVGSKQLKKNAVTTAKLKKNSVSTAKIKNNAVTTPKIKNGAITGAKVNLGSLGTVPSAATANSANSLAGQTTFAVRLGFGQSQVVATHSAVSFVASCKREGSDIAEVLFQTTASGAVAEGEDEYDGSAPAEFLNADTPAADRVLSDVSTTTGSTLVTSDIDDGFVLGPDGRGLVANTEGIILGLNYGAPGCYIAGVVNAVG